MEYRSMYFPPEVDKFSGRSSLRVMTLITNVVASRHIKREEVLLPVAVHRSKMPVLKLNFIRGNENVTHSAQSEFSGRSKFPV